MKKNKKESRKELVRAEIDSFMKSAELCEPGSVEANRYAAKIWRRSLKYRIPLGLTGRRICRKCHAWLFWGRNARIRFRPGMIVLTCHGCGNIRRIRHK